ncbi:ABC transporter substrate-binding protein [Leucobacter luti]|uniref:NitT/TauT family transport system substrate-binding protein n=1 Tax=Leucobacter luti TaxID=340320 RepID=A0A4Q7U125_9MICO|nr:ABC transporter substrate-binding protein [Leucobacter luti]MBL3698860.1 ABC transporter substrate-binding protein [Leucobacter luti]RZT66238.1 NitT/TauT family transport system substrate-binding protein [Leucobacter luti]
MKRTATLTIALLSAVALAGCSAGGNAAEGDDTGESLKQVTFAVTDQTLSAATASYATVPGELGYFAEEGLEVTMQPVETALSGVQAVAAGNAVCTYASAATAVPSAASDPTLALVGSTEGNMFRVVAPKSSGYTSVADLEGKTIGSNSATATGINYAIGGMEAAGATATTEQFLPVGFGAQAALAFQQGQIDAYSAWDSPNLVIESLLGEELVDLDSVMNDLNGTSIFVCSRDAVDTEPETVAGIWRAFFKGAVFSLENPEAAIKLHWEKFPSAKPTDGSEEDRLALAVRQLEVRLELTGGEGSAGTYGEQTDEDMQKTVDLLTEYGVIEADGEVPDVSELFDYSLIPAINDFDPEAIREQARNYTE